MVLSCCVAMLFYLCRGMQGSLLNRKYTLVPDGMACKCGMLACGTNHLVQACAHMLCLLAALCRKLVSPVINCQLTHSAACRLQLWLCPTLSGR
jgi:hypothetical protein